MAKVLGIDFDKQTLMMAGAAVVAAFAISSIFRSRSPLAAASGPDVDRLFGSVLEAFDVGARAASGGIGAGSAIAIEGIGSGARLAERGLDLAGRVTGSLERIAESEAFVLGDVTERAIGALERITTAPAPRVSPPPAAAALPAVPDAPPRRVEPPAPPPPAARAPLPEAPLPASAWPPPTTQAEPPLPGTILRAAATPGTYVVQTEHGRRFVSPEFPMVRTVDPATGTFAVNSVGLAGDALHRYVANIQILSGVPSRVAAGRAMLAELGD